MKVLYTECSLYLQHRWKFLNYFTYGKATEKKEARRLRLIEALNSGINHKNAGIRWKNSALHSALGRLAEEVWFPARRTDNGKHNTQATRHPPGVKY